jgi:predicted phage terminase large subunit-like protein
MLSADLASSQKDSADYTAIVGARVYGYGKDLRVLILPNPINERMLFPPSMQKLKDLYDELKRDGNTVKLVVEDVGFQAVAVQQLNDDDYPAQGWHPAGSDKRARLSVYSTTIQHGQVLFPQQGAEALIRQIVGFGSEAHDDLVDAFTMLLAVVKEDKSQPPIHINFRKRDFYGPHFKGLFP